MGLPRTNFPSYNNIANGHISEVWAHRRVITNSSYQYKFIYKLQVQYVKRLQQH